MKTKNQKLNFYEHSHILNQKAFKIRINYSRTDKTIRLLLSGPGMLEKWVKEIGFSSIKKYSKYLFWKKFGYYIPNITYKKRLILIRERSQAAKIGKHKATNSKRAAATRLSKGSSPFAPFYFIGGLR